MSRDVTFLGLLVATGSTAPARRIATTDSGTLSGQIDAAIDAAIEDLGQPLGWSFQVLPRLALKVQNDRFACVTIRQMREKLGVQRNTLREPLAGFGHARYRHEIWFSFGSSFGTVMAPARRIANKPETAHS